MQQNLSIKLVITDIDGVWTDGSMYYTEQGDEIKRFHTYDGVGVNLLQIMDVPVAIITGENTEMVRRRAEKLKIKYVYQGIKKKLIIIKKLCKQLNISLKEVAYLGDDIGDAIVLQKVGISAAPANAPVYIQKMVDIVLPTKGGDGAFRTFVEWLLEREGLLEEALRMSYERTV